MTCQVSLAWEWADSLPLSSASRSVRRSSSRLAPKRHRSIRRSPDHHAPPDLEWRVGARVEHDGIDRAVGERRHELRGSLDAGFGPHLKAVARLVERSDDRCRPQRSAAGRMEQKEEDHDDYTEEGLNLMNKGNG